AGITIGGVGDSGLNPARSYASVAVAVGRTPMQQYLAALMIVLLFGTVFGRVLLLRRTGTRAMHFGELDKTDFLIPLVALGYFYTVFAAAFDWPLVSSQRFFRSATVGWLGVGLCLGGGSPAHLRRL
ncbi:MAG: hypothetical protein ACRD0L_16960, partial [Acidimicrobiales bacterium]